jgi:glycosyltransferase involved in cell wall biosynthesis
MLPRRNPAALLRPMPAAAEITVLHYTGARDDRGGIMSMLRALSTEARFKSLLGVDRAFAPAISFLPAVHFSRVDAEVIGARTIWCARHVAREAQAWLASEPDRVFHAHSRAGMVAALWLARRGERRVVASVHCYGRHRWFYRWAARELKDRLYWLTPAMKRYYGIDPGGSWNQCMPPCIADAMVTTTAHSRRDRQKPVRLAGAGLLAEWKGWHLMLEAFALLPASVRARLHFTHIGSSDASTASIRYAKTLRERTAALGLTQNIQWSGEQASSRPLLEASDCAVVLSSHEPFSMVMLEALALRVPVLASAAGGPSDVLQAGSNGWFFQPDDAGDLARQLAMLAETDALEAAQVTTEHVQRFRASVVGAEWGEIYRRLLG